MMTFLDDYRPILTAVTFGLLGIAFYLSYRPRHSTAGEVEGGASAMTGAGSRMMTLNKIMLWVATAAAVLFLLFPQGVTGLFASDGEFSSDMQRTIIQIEGMT